MEEWTESPALRVHMEAVACAMAWYARRLVPDEPGAVERFTVCGLLHDFDYERHPTPEEHPFVGVAHLRELGVEEEILEAILGHAQYSGTPRTTPMAKALFACDELAGFLVACAKVRPDGLAGMKPSSVKKKLKDRSFAAAVSREDIAQGASEFGVDITDHIAHLIEALSLEAGRFGLAPRTES